MSHQDEALQDIVTIARANSLTIEQISAALTGETTKRLTKGAAAESILKRLFSYLGGIFIFSGICIFVGMHWVDFGSAARVVVTLGIGFIAFVMALVALSDTRYEKAATPLFLIAALLQPSGILVMLTEYSSGGNAKHGVLFMATVMLIQQGVTFLAKRETVLAFSSIFFGAVFCTTLLDIVEFDEELTGLLVGSSLMCIAYALTNSRHRAIAPFWFFLGSIATMASFYRFIDNTPIEIFFLGLSSFFVYLSTVVRSRTLLLTGTLGMLWYLGYFTSRHFWSATWWPLSLIVVGVLFLGVGSLAVRLNRKYIQR